ncbi:MULTISPECIES: diaminopimelate epimerase [unclassified Streptomyces]|uniref:diaminopimelate epimerase n=1 Tax=unclassified Streptomyces TaxID=2593676 RepID=UPI00136EBF61|nr:diaminopimelate epimerase [Streptomyces sp. SHP 1-2]MCW5251169.1 diaminopimelate epimerase [Streptomyces sp. SHP 1-2]MYU23213.1 diaminopimelate epimerase [Streptomyces sp. SID8352]
MTDFFKYQAAGNDYVVIDPRGSGFTVSPETIRLICDRHRGIGADGVLFGPLEQPRPGVPVPLALYNSDGSDCGRSGNGLRMFALHLAAREPGGWADGREFVLRTPAGDCPVRILDVGAGRVQIGMGRPDFSAAALPLLAEDGTPHPGRAVRVPLTVDGERLTVTSLHNGNPHTVVPVDEPTPELARRLGPGIARHPRFPGATNVQFLRMLDRGVMLLEVFERGAGYVTASGSSACAAVSAARELGLCDSRVEVRMPGGTAEITVAADGGVTMTGDAEQVAAGTFAPALRARLDRLTEEVAAR